jgi:class 3 adenylate cyclase/tetratricopeptide (TPR) repeat protein
MTCPRCQQDNPTHARFCLGCGARLALTCGSCGAELPGGARFCLQCGQAVIAGTVAAVGSPAPETYTPRHLAEKILTSKAALEGERKQVTVLFADLKGSMELLADRDPEDARKLLDPVLQLMMDAVHRYEGTVNQVMGDGIMALFGAPLAHEDHAVRACYAALRMQERVKAYAEEVRRAHAAAVKIRVGLNSGEVVVRAIGSDLHMDYTAVGQTTHLAARMEQLAEPGSIVITPATLALAESFVDVKSLGPVQVKGLAAPVEVYEVTGAGPARTRLQASVRRGLTRFVGRDMELEQLFRVQQLAGSGRGQLAAIVGEAGVGKSRLVYELTRSHRLQGWLTLHCGSVSYGKATSYWPVIDLLKVYFKVDDRDGARELREKLTGKLLTLDRALEPSLPALLTLLDVPVDDAAWPMLEPAQRRERTLDALKQLLLREAREQPLLLVVEDLHWIDGETQALLDALVDSLGSARLLLLVNYRPEYRHGWGHKTYYSQMRLDALPAEGTAELLDALLGEDATLASLKQLLAKRGNPFFLEETVRTLAETGVLAGARGRHRLTQTVQAIEVPATVQAILAARIDRLALEDKRLLQMASVVAKNVPLALLHAIAELEAEALRRGLDHLQAAEFLYETSLFPELEYSFTHALTLEVAYGGLLQERRRVLHARIVGALETLSTNRPGGEIERLAHHAFRGELWEQAVGYLQQAGRNASARFAIPEAVGYYDQALAALAHLPETGETLAQAVDIHQELQISLYSHGELERQLQVARDAERLARMLADPRRLASSTAALGRALAVAGRPASEVLLPAEAAVTIAAAVGDVVLQADATLYAGQARLYAGDLRGSEAALRDVVQMLDGELRQERLTTSSHFPAVYARCLLVWSLAERGEFDQAATDGGEAIDLAEIPGPGSPDRWGSTGQPTRVIPSCWALGYLYAVKGDLALAIRWWERGITVSREAHRAVPAGLMLGSLCYVLALSGRVADGLAQLDQAIDTHETLRAGGIVHSIVAVHLGEACVLSGVLRSSPR